MDAHASAHQSYVERSVAGWLSAYVSCTWTQRVAAGASDYLHRTVPNGSVELSCRIGSLPRIVGPHSRPRVGRLEAGAEVIGIRFRPGVASAVLGVAADELRDDCVDLDTVWGTAALQVGERIAVAPTTTAALVVLEAAVEAVRRLDAGVTRGLASTLSISDRQLRRRLTRALGYGARTYSRIVRFQTFLALTQTVGGCARMTDLAAAAGYTDQAHLTHESLRLSGLTPTAFVASMRQQCGPTHDHRVSYAPLLQRAAAAGALAVENRAHGRPH